MLTKPWHAREVDLIYRAPAEEGVGVVRGRKWGSPGENSGPLKKRGDHHARRGEGRWGGGV